MAGSTEKQYQDLYFLRFLKKISKCICDNSIFLPKDTNKTVIFLLISITYKEEGWSCTCGPVIKLLHSSISDYSGNLRLVTSA